MRSRSWWMGLATTVAVGLLTTAQARRVPEKRPTDLERGKELYERHCQSCHGAQNHGDGPATESLVHVVPDLAGKVEVDSETIDLVRIGKGAMPGFAASFIRSDTKRVLTYMKQAHEVTEEEPSEEPDPATDTDDE